MSFRASHRHTALKTRLVKFQSSEWKELVLKGWLTIKIYNFGLAEVALNPLVKMR